MPEDPFSDIGDLFESGDNRQAVRAYGRAKAAERGIDPDFADRLWTRESGYNRHALNKETGAAGIGQMIPGTARRFGLQDPHDAKQSIDKSLDYLQGLHRKFGGDTRRMAAGYFAGEGQSDRALANPKGNPKTQAYANAVGGPPAGGRPRPTPTPKADPFGDISDLFEGSTPAQTFAPAPKARPTASGPHLKLAMSHLTDDSGAPLGPASAIIAGKLAEEDQARRSEARSQAKAAARPKPQAAVEPIGPPTPAELMPGARLDRSASGRQRIVQGPTQPAPVPENAHVAPRTPYKAPGFSEQPRYPATGIPVVDVALTKLAQGAIGGVGSGVRAAGQVLDDPASIADLVTGSINPTEPILQRIRPTPRASDALRGRQLSTTEPAVAPTNPVYRAGQAISEAAETGAENEDTFVKRLPRMAGGFAPIVAAGVAGPGGPIALMAAQTRDAMYQDALAHGATERQAADAATQGTQLGTALGIIPAGAAARAPMGIAKTLGREALLGGAIGAGQKGGENFIANRGAGYDPNRPTMQGVPQAIAEQAAIGPMMALPHAIGGRITPRTKPEPGLARPEWLPEGVGSGEGLPLGAQYPAERLQKGAIINKLDRNQPLTATEKASIQAEQQQQATSRIQKKLAEGKPLTKAEMSSLPTEPEAPGTLQAQIEAVKSGGRKAVLVTPGEEVPARHGLSVTDTAVGRFLYDANQTSARAIRRRVGNGTYHELLGIVEPKSAKTTEAVVARSPEGEEQQAAMVSPEKAPEQARKLAEQFPDATVAVESPEKVVADRRKNSVLREAVNRVKAGTATPEDHAMVEKALYSHDLTGIPNRRAYKESNEIDTESHHGAIDVVGLKDANDKYGHGTGDKLLKKVAEVVAEEHPERAFHISGDEFALKGTPEEVATAMGNIRERLNRATVDYEAPDGTIHQLEGIKIHHGIGASEDAANIAVNVSKGTVPKTDKGRVAGGLVEKPAAGGQDSQRVSPAKEVAPEPVKPTEPIAPSKDWQRKGAGVKTEDSLFTAIKKLGGINLGSENRGEHRWLREGERGKMPGLFRSEGGMNWDDAQHTLEAHGYGPFEDTHAFMNALDKEARGEHQHQAQHLENLAADETALAPDLQQAYDKASEHLFDDMPWTKAFDKVHDREQPTDAEIQDFAAHGQRIGLTHEQLGDIYDRARLENGDKQGFDRFSRVAPETAQAGTRTPSGPSKKQLTTEQYDRVVELKRSLDERGELVDDYLRQQGIFGKELTPEQESLLKELDTRSPRRKATEKQASLLEPTSQAEPPSVTITPNVGREGTGIAAAVEAARSAGDSETAARGRVQGAFSTATRDVTRKVIERADTDIPGLREQIERRLTKDSKTPTPEQVALQLGGHLKTLELGKGGHDTPRAHHKRFGDIQLIAKTPDGAKILFGKVDADGKGVTYHMAQNPEHELLSNAHLNAKPEDIAKLPTVSWNELGTLGDAHPPTAVIEALGKKLDLPGKGERAPSKEWHKLSDIPDDVAIEHFPEVFRNRVKQEVSDPQWADMAIQQMDSKPKANEPKIISDWRDDVRNGGLGANRVDLIAKGMTVAAYDTYRDLKNFKDWSKKMITDWGQSIKPKLTDMWEAATKASRQAQQRIGQWVKSFNRGDSQAGFITVGMATGGSSKPKATAPAPEGKFWRNVGDVANAPRALMSSLDISAPLRQGAIFSLSEPIASGKAAKDMFKALVSNKANYEKLNQKIEAHPDYKRAVDAGVDFTHTPGSNVPLTGREESFMSGLVGKLPHVKYAEQAYVTFLNSQRLNVFSKFSKELASKSAKPEAYNDVAKFINYATGRGDLGKLGNSIGPALNALFFSPRYAASRLQTPAFVFDPRVSGPARRIAIRKLAQFAGVVGSAITLAKLGGAEVNTDPDDSDFLKIKVGDTRYDALAGFQQYFVFAHRLTTGFTNEASGEKNTPQTDPNEVVKRFLRGKLAPAPSLLWDWRTGRKVTGEEFSWSDAALDRLAPMIVNDARKAWETEGLTGMAKTTPSLVGIGVQTYTRAPQAGGHSRGRSERATRR